MTRTEELIALAEARSAHNYHPLPVVVAAGDGAWVTDVEGKRYVDCLCAYSAVNFGHNHPVLVQAAIAQLHRVAVTSRAVHSEPFAGFMEALCQLTGKDLALPMNSGAEAVETGLKLARKWGYEAKGVAPGRAKVITMAQNFHGRTISIVTFSSDPESTNGFGPFTPGFESVPFGDLAALERAIDADTVAVLLEPIQGEAGIIVPPDGYLKGVRELTKANNVLMVADEIQSGLGRVGATFACDLEGVVPDLYLMGKALGGGLLPVSAVAGDRSVLGLLKPGQHGSTFGGNPLACAVGTAVVDLLQTGEYQTRSRDLGGRLHHRLQALVGHGVTAARGKGLWAGVDIDPALGTARSVCERLLAKGVIAKDTHTQTIRLAPALVITEADLDWVLDRLEEALAEAGAR
jgi:ornithine--oxo-acid transaminase